MKIDRFILIATALAAAMFFLCYGFVTWLDTSYHLGAIGAAIVVALIPTWLAYALTYMGLDKDTTRFVGFLASGMLGKMLIGVLAIVLVAVQFKEVRDEYVVTYIISYFVFTAFEVYGLIRKLRPKF